MNIATFSDLQHAMLSQSAISLESNKENTQKIHCEDTSGLNYRERFSQGSSNENYRVYSIIETDRDGTPKKKNNVMQENPLSMCEFTEDSLSVTAKYQDNAMKKRNKATTSNISNEISAFQAPKRQSYVLKAHDDEVSTQNNTNEIIQ
jgi:hypothetical protein